jgi:hypothetical protein
MRKFLMPSVLALALAGGAVAAMADSSPDKLAAAGSMSLEQVTSHLQSQGYQIKKIKLDDGRYKVKAIDATGHKEKLYVSPQNGDVLSKGVDNDDD